MNDISEEKETPKLFDFQLKSSRFGIDVRIPCIKLSDNHPCKGCVWYDRNTDVLFCPFHSCVRYRKGFDVPKKKVNETWRYFLRRFESRGRLRARRYSSCAGGTE